MTALDFRLGGKVGNYLLSTLMRKFRGQSTGFAPASSDSDHTSDDHEHDRGVAKIERHFGPLIWQKFAGKRVLDFGCGWGFETIAVAEKGAAVSYGLDDQQIHVDHGNKLAQERGVANTCRFINSAATGNELHSLYGSLDVIFSIDAFEHYFEPEQVLAEMYALLAPGGRVVASFGRPWLHPYGAHLQTLTSLPWVHLLFKESTIFDVRARSRPDGARRFEDIPGGPNRMTVRRFRRIIEASPFEVTSFDRLPVRGLRLLATNAITTEFFCAQVRCDLRKPSVR
jgi:2-polyprenyl-3-methyl-5-hydroxy-6-metoxy-1,4-benzoquinol methylase